jgi:cell division protein FtsQ
VKTKEGKSKSGKRPTGSSVAAEKRSRMAKARHKKPSVLRRKMPGGEGRPDNIEKSKHKEKAERRRRPEEAIEPALTITAPTVEQKRSKSNRRKNKEREPSHTIDRKMKSPSTAESATAGVMPTVEQKRSKALRKISPRARSLRMTALVTIMLLSLAVLLWVYTSTGVLNIKNIDVKGNYILGTNYLRSLSGITADTHLIKMDVKAAENALLSEPYVASVSISRRFPNTVVLDIVEREPQASILQNGKYHLVDQHGVVLASTDEKPPGLTEIKDAETPLLYSGNEITGGNFAVISELLSSMPSSLRDITTTAGYQSGDGLYLEAKGTRVIYGDSSDLSRKNTIALLALTGLVSHYNGVEYIDVSFPDHPVIKPF